MNIDVEITEKSQWGRPIYRLRRPLTFRINEGPVRIAARVPGGYETDLASVPFFFWWFASPHGPWRRAAIIHDYLCDCDIDRFMADAIFRCAMKQDGVDTLHRVIIYYAVRLYWVCWGMWFGS